jgi:hypothetical protein
MKQSDTRGVPTSLASFMITSNQPVYRLGEADLAFAELLPEKPSWMEQEEDEERISIGLHPA